MLEYSETVTIERNYYFEIAGEKLPNEEDKLWDKIYSKE